MWARTVIHPSNLDCSYREKRLRVINQRVLLSAAQSDILVPETEMAFAVLLLISTTNQSLGFLRESHAR